LVLALTVTLAPLPRAEAFQPPGPYQISDAVVFPCPFCHEEVDASIEMVGNQANCPHCRNRIEVPKPEWKVELAPRQDQPVQTLRAAGEGTDVTCPQCDGPLQVSGEMVGKQMICPHCRRVITVPKPVEKQPSVQLAPLMFDRENKQWEDALRQKAFEETSREQSWTRVILFGLLGRGGAVAAIGKALSRRGRCGPSSQPPA
jgi:hypothetical protein